MVISSLDNLLTRMRANRLRQEAVLARLRDEADELIRDGWASGADDDARRLAVLKQQQRDRRLPACR